LLLKRSRILGKSTAITNLIRSWRQQELVLLPYRWNETTWMVCHEPLSWNKDSERVRWDRCSYY
jgi:hypothetical protein